MGKTVLARLVVGSFLVFMVPGCAMSAQNSGTKVLTGTIRVVGNEPFTHVVLTVGKNADQAIGDRDYLIVGPLGEQLRKQYQGKKLTVRGTYCTPPDPGFKKCFNPSVIFDGDDGSSGN
jgi:hypothetical protein